MTGWVSGWVSGWKVGDRLKQAPDRLQTGARVHRARVDRVDRWGGQGRVDRALGRTGGVDRARVDKVGWTGGVDRAGWTEH